MKKIFLLSFAIVLLVSLFAEKTLNIFKKDLSVLNIVTTSVDSIKFDADNMNIYKSDNSTLSVPVSATDSMNFSESVSPALASLDTLTLASVLNTTAIANIKIKSTGGTSIVTKGICWSTTENPTIDNNKLASTTLLANSSVSITGLTAATTYYARAYATNASGTAYSNQVSFTTTNYALPTVETTSATYNYSTNAATCVVKVSSNGGCTLTERGICWSTSQNPTTANSKFTSGTSVGQFYAQMSNLNVNSTYYVRAFATNCVGTSYGAQLKVQALMGNVTYTLDIDKTAYPTEYNLIKIAMDSACWYYNRYTNFRGNVYVYYNAGIPTAQASYHGSLGFGPNTRYMWVGTAIHEMAHYVGSGTTTAWRAQLSGGVWQGATAKALLLSATGEVLKGDNNSNAQHFWPYGINQKEEITGLGDANAQKNGLILATKLVKAMCVDDAKLPTSW